MVRIFARVNLTLWIRLWNDSIKHCLDHNKPN
jgi:hypothetical protein